MRWKTRKTHFTRDKWLQQRRNTTGAVKLQDFKSIIDDTISSRKSSLNIFRLYNSSALQNSDFSLSDSRFKYDSDKNFKDDVTSCAHRFPKTFPRKTLSFIPDFVYDRKSRRMKNERTAFDNKDEYLIYVKWLSSLIHHRWQFQFKAIFRE